MNNINTLNILELVGDLRSNTEKILNQIDQDDRLNKRQRDDNGLVIANASKGLFSPEEHHHLYAKGIVYKRNPYELVSLPLLKIYNYGENDLITGVTDQMCDRDVNLTCPAKPDGYMAQFFEHKGEVYVSTRSVLEGTGGDIDFDGIDYVGQIRKIASEKYNNLLNPEVVEGLSLVGEVIHPDLDNITKYDGLRDIILLSVYDLEDHRYWTNDEVHRFAGEHDLNPVDFRLKEPNSFDETLEKLDELGDEDHIPEGMVACFEHGNEIVHRVKLKTEEWRRKFSLKFSCSIQTTTEKIWENPEFKDWDKFKEHLISEGLTEEECLDFYKEYHDKYLNWLEEVDERVDKIKSIYNNYVDSSEDDFKPKELVFYLRENHPKDVFSLVMNYYRSNEDDESLRLDVMWKKELYSGIKRLIQERKDNL